MAWTLEYLGRGEVSLSALLFEGWAQQGYPVSTQPRLPPPANSTLTSTPTSGPPSRSWRSPNPPKLLDLRSPEEFNASEEPTARRIQPALDRVSWQRPPALASRLRPGAPPEQSGHRTHGQGSHLLHHRRTRRYRLPGPQARRLRRSRPTQPPLTHLPCPRGCGDPSPSHAPTSFSRERRPLNNRHSDTRAGI